jgi:hypothetical protein
MKNCGKTRVCHFVKVESPLEKGDSFKKLLFLHVLCYFCLLL